MLTEYNAENHPSVNAKGLFLSINKAGVFKLNMIAVKQLKLQPGDKLALLNDPKRPTDWYLTKSEKGFPVRPSSGNEKGLLFNSSKVAITIKDSLKWPQEKTLKVKLGNEWYQEQGVTVVALLTKPALSSLNKAA